MPELPEVETVRRTLSPVLRGRRFVRATIRLPKLVAQSPLALRGLVGDRIRDVRRRGKLLLIDLQSGRTVVIHLKMTGQLIHERPGGALRIGGHPIAGGADRLPNRFTRAIFGFDDKSRLYFNDLRKFGYLRLMPTVALPGYLESLGFGPEPLSRSFTLAAFRAGLARRKNARIKDVLLDQTVLAGLGNIYADEVNFASLVHPARRAGSLTDREVEAMYRAIRRILRFAVAKRGTTIRHYRDGRGSEGSMQRYLKVYGRTGLPCRRCRTTIMRIKLGGRSAHFCPECQKLNSKS